MNSPIATFPRLPMLKPARDGLPEEICVNCAYFFPAEPTAQNLKGPAMGFCRRYPPHAQLVIAGMNQAGPVHMPAAICPPVAETFGCGEWRLKITDRPGGSS